VARSIVLLTSRKKGICFSPPALALSSVLLSRWCLGSWSRDQRWSVVCRRLLVWNKVKRRLDRGGDQLAGKAWGWAFKRFHMGRD
jgi:hypothetical protein